ncbi:MAG: epimerase [Cyanobacteria bacterium PR.3.49]|nr:epimerase [Cyanobacteria bacterium PR.3.49]
MKLLILGGTVFLGRHIVSAALEAGHSVTTFNRGTHILAEHQSIEKLHGDREKNLDALQNRSWDAVIDTCGYAPDAVSKSAEALKDSADNYVFISSISVFKNFAARGMNESAPVKSIESGDEVEYGSLKAACEKAVERAFCEGSTIIRPGLIVGPYDPTDRFTYWPSRVSKGGRVIAPGAPERCIQFIDVRDLAKWTIRLIENQSRGTFNATGPEKPLSMREFLNECNAVGGNSAQFVWMNDEALAEAKVDAWMEMPLWIPASDEEHRGFLHMDCSKGQSAGLQYSPLSKTIRDTLTWSATRDASHVWKAGLAADKECRLLQSN